MMSDCPGPGRTTIFDHHVSSHSTDVQLRQTETLVHEPTNSTEHSDPGGNRGTCGGVNDCLRNCAYVRVSLVTSHPSKRNVGII